MRDNGDVADMRGEVLPDLPRQIGGVADLGSDAQADRQVADADDGRIAIHGVQFAGERIKDGGKELAFDHRLDGARAVLRAAGKAQRQRKRTDGQRAHGLAPVGDPAGDIPHRRGAETAPAQMFLQRTADG